MSSTSDQIIEETSGAKSVMGRRLALFMIIAAIVCLVGTMVATVIAYTTVQNQAKRGTDLALQVRDACADPSRAHELGDLCPTADDVVDSAPPSVSQGDPGEPGEDGEDGTDGEDGAPGPPPSDAQVANAVALYCSGGRCDGADATQSQVASAVAMYCDNRGQCRGPSGADGVDGQDGQDGSNGADGPQGPPPSDEQVASAVAAYCSTRNECRGPAGEDGQPGDAVTGGSCQYDGVGTISITIQTSSGPTQFSCNGVGNNPEGTR